MRSIRVIGNTLFALLFTVIFCATSFAEPANLGEAKKSLRDYYNSGLYFKEIEQIATKADQYIVHEATLNAHNKHPKKLAIVLDIDETALSYYAPMEKRNFCYDPISAHDEILRADAPAITPVLALYHDAIKHNVAVFFVTARP